MRVDGELILRESARLNALIDDLKRMGFHPSVHTGRRGRKLYSILRVRCSEGDVKRVESIFNKHGFWVSVKCLGTECSVSGEREFTYVKP